MAMTDEEAAEFRAREAKLRAAFSAPSWDEKTISELGAALEEFNAWLSELVARKTK